MHLTSLSRAKRGFTAALSSLLTGWKEMCLIRTHSELSILRQEILLWVHQFRVCYKIKSRASTVCFNSCQITAPLFPIIMATPVCHCVLRCHMLMYFILLCCTGQTEKHLAIRFDNWDATQSVSPISINKMKVSQTVQITAVILNMLNSFWNNQSSNGNSQHAF